MVPAARLLRLTCDLGLADQTPVLSRCEELGVAVLDGLELEHLGSPLDGWSFTS
jgi:hypothetical protein